MALPKPEKFTEVRDLVDHLMGTLHVNMDLFKKDEGTHGHSVIFLSGEQLDEKRCKSGVVMMGRGNALAETIAHATDENPDFKQVIETGLEIGEENSDGNNNSKSKGRSSDDFLKGLHGVLGDILAGRKDKNNSN